MHELLLGDDFNVTAFIGLVTAAVIIGSASGGIPGTASLGSPVIALVVTQFASVQVLVIPLLVFAQFGVIVTGSWRNVNWKEMRPLIIPTAFGAFLGTLAWWFVLRWQPSWQLVLKFLCGLVVLFSAFAMAWERLLDRGPLISLNEGRRSILAIVGSFFSTAANSAGPLFSWCLQTRGLDKHALTGTVAALFLWMNSLKFPQYYLAGLYQNQTMLKVPWDYAWLVLLIAIALASISIGRTIRHKASEKWFVGIIVLLSSVVGTLVLTQSVMGLIRLI